MLGWIIGALFCAVAGCAMNYAGITLLIKSLTLYGADAIVQFMFGLLVIIISLGFFAFFAICGREIIDDGKGE